MQLHDQTGRYGAELGSSARLAFWTLAWVVTLALAQFGPEHLWDSEPVASWAAVAANVVVGIGWIVAHARFLQSVDELDRKIQLDALAVALGAGWVVGFAYVTADDAELVSSHVDVALLPVLMAAVYLSAIFVGKMRFR